MPDIEDELGRMSSRQLVELQARIHDAIRAHIRLKNALKAAASQSAPPAPLPQVEQLRQQSLARRHRDGNVTKANPANAATIQAGARAAEQPRVADGAFDLERERDAWLARKRGTGR